MKAIGEACSPRPRAAARRSVLRLGAIGISLAMLAGAVAACSGGSSSEPSSSGSPVLRVGLAQVPATLNPATSPIGASQVVLGFTNEPLLHLKSDGTFAPGLATSWRFLGASNQQFELTLRNNARFSDGSPVTAAAVVGWIQYFAKAQGSNSTALAVKSVEATGEFTVRIDLASPSAIVPRVLSDGNYWGSIACPAAVANPTAFATKSCGAGPYTIETSQSVAGSKYTMVPNKYYYDKSQVRFSKIEFTSIPTPTSMLQSFQTGQLDVALGDLSTADQAVSLGLQVKVGVAAVTGLFFLDKAGAQVKALGDERVRQALTRSIAPPS
jgi:peptide/nickel transport system substrate-binding protein